MDSSRQAKRGSLGVKVDIRFKLKGNILVNKIRLFMRPQRMSDLFVDMVELFLFVQLTEWILLDFSTLSVPLNKLNEFL